MPTKRIYASSSGDIWDLVRDDETGRVTIRHQPNLASGGRASEIELDVFLAVNRGKAEAVALIELIGSLVQDAPGSINEEPAMKPTDTQVIVRAKQLFEEEKGRPWDASLLKGIAAMPPAGLGEDEQSAYIDRARRELDEIEEEGHS